jgi:hypothetical protein
MNWLKDAIPPEVTLLFGMKPEAGRLGYRLGTSIKALPRDTPHARRRRQRRALNNEQRRLDCMKAVLPPGRGNRRNEFSSPLPTRWATAEGKETSRVMEWPTL